MPLFLFLVSIVSDRPVPIVFKPWRRQIGLGFVIAPIVNGELNKKKATRRWPFAKLNYELCRILLTATTDEQYRTSQSDQQR